MNNYLVKFDVFSLVRFYVSFSTLALVDGHQERHRRAINSAPIIPQGSPLGIQLDTECLWKSGFEGFCIGGFSLKQYVSGKVGLRDFPSQCLWKSGFWGSAFGIQLDTEYLWKSGFRCSAFGIQLDTECLWKSGFEGFSIVYPA